MKHLRIRNKGLVQAEDIMLIGSSTKRGQNDKIGQFGSGWKYAIAWLVRNECTPFIFSGTEQITITTRMVQHRDNLANIIQVNGKDTSITDGMGMKWTGWMALRELISNAIDEGEEIIKIMDEKENWKVNPGYTNIYIPINKELQDVMDKYEHYFAFERTPDYISKYGALYIKQENTQVNVYRKGIRCFDAHYKTKVDFNFNNIPITEDRLIDGGVHKFDECAQELLENCDDVAALKAAILSEYRDIHPSTCTDTYVAAYKELIAEGYTFTTRTFKEVLGAVTDGVVISSYHHGALVHLGLISNPLEAVFRHLDFVFKQVDNDMGKGAEIIQFLSKFGQFKVYFGTMDSWQPIKVKDNEFYIKKEEMEEDSKLLAAKCLIVHESAAELISGIL